MLSPGTTAVLAIWILVTVSCALEPQERKSVVFDGPNGKVECLEPPREILNKESTVQTEVAVKNLGTLAKGSAGLKIDPARVRQELKPGVANWEVIDYRICAQYARGVLAREDYRTFTKEILPVLQEGPGSVEEPSSVRQETHGPNSPSNANVGGDVFNIITPQK
jgi:hypothetical protein